MVLGEAGSGKTTIIMTIIKILAKMKQRVLLVNFTNQSIDGLLVQLKESGFNDFIRIASNVNSVNEKIRDNVRTYHMFDSMAQIRETFDNTYIYGATCL